MESPPSSHSSRQLDSIFTLISAPIHQHFLSIVHSGCTSDVATSLFLPSLQQCPCMSLLHPKYYPLQGAPSHSREKPRSPPRTTGLRCAGPRCPRVSTKDSVKTPDRDSSPPSSLFTQLWSHRPSAAPQTLLKGHPLL